MTASDEDDRAHAPDEIREAVGTDLPDAEVRDVTPIEAGSNSVYRATVEERGTPESETPDSEVRELVLKVGDHHFPEGCRAEPYLLDAVAERTEIPVPEVVATGHLDDDPYFLAEAVSGANLDCAPERLDPAAFERVCADAGRHLADLHVAFPADGWGMLGRERGADDLELVREFPDWPTYFEAWLAHNVERLEDTRFADLVPALDDQVAILADELRELGPFDPVVTHGDYRLANLLVDSDSGATGAVVDWATPTAVPAIHDLAVTEAVLLDWPQLDDERQRRLREQFYEGYREGNPEVLDREGFEAHRRLCRFGARLRLMVNLDEEMAGHPRAAVDARAREHREWLAEYGAL